MENKSFKVEKSKELFDRAWNTIAGGVNSIARGPHGGVIPGTHPLYFEKGIGSHIWDVDGNEYIDYLIGQGTLLLGYAYPAVNEAIIEQMNKVQHTGMSNELEIKVAEKMVNHMPCAELVMMSNTGTEVCTFATRIARAQTGKMKMIKFEGVYNGWTDMWMVDTLYDPVGVRAPKGGLEHAPLNGVIEPGVPQNVMENMVVLPWNNIQVLETYIERNHHQVAGVILEASGVGGVIMPKKGYLEAVRKLTEQYGILLIVDEVKTGYRLALGGAQEYFNIKGDIATVAKAMANGWPTAAICGKKEYLGPIIDYRMEHNGTLNGHPVVMAACLANLTELEKPETYDHLYNVTGKLTSGWKDTIQDLDIEMQLLGPGANSERPAPMWNYVFTNKREINSARDMKEIPAHPHSKRKEKFVLELVKRGIHNTDHPWALTRSHTEEDINKTLEAIREVLKLTKSIT